MAVVAKHGKSLVDDLPLSVAAFIDVLAPFVSATALFESATFISPYVYARIQALIQHTNTVLTAQDCPASLPNVFALLARAPRGTNIRARWQFCQSAIRPGLAYFYELFHNFKDDVDDDDDATPVNYLAAVDLFRFVIFHVCLVNIIVLYFLSAVIFVP